jgi:predicted acylesterase/phospholipase RssA
MIRFVSATQVTDSRPVKLRGYPAHYAFGNIPGVKIWQAARATSAAPTFFKSMTIGEEEFFDGGLRANNPVELVNDEAEGLFPGEPKIIVSIGTGIPPDPSLSGNLKRVAEGLASMATQTEDTDRNFKLYNKHEIDAGRLQVFRYNVDTIGDIGLEEWKRLGDLKQKTRSYLNKDHVKESFAQCVDAISEMCCTRNY